VMKRLVCQSGRAVAWRAVRQPLMLRNPGAKAIAAVTQTVPARSFSQEPPEYNEFEEGEKKVFDDVEEDDEDLPDHMRGAEIDGKKHLYLDSTQYAAKPWMTKNVNFDRLNRWLSTEEDKFFSSGTKKEWLDMIDQEGLDATKEAAGISEVDIELANNAVDHQKFINTITHSAWLKTTGRRRQVGGATTESFTTLVIGGNEKGMAGFGIGRGAEGFKSWENSISNLRQNMLHLEMHENRTLFHPVSGRHKTSRVEIMPLPRGSGMCSNAPVMREIFMCFGLEDVTSKVHGSRNPFNIVQAVWNALSENTSWREIALTRGKNVYRMLEPRLYRPRYPTTEDMEKQKGMVAGMLANTEKEWEERGMARKETGLIYDERWDGTNEDIPLYSVPQVPSVPPPMAR